MKCDNALLVDIILKKIKTKEIYIKETKRVAYEEDDLQKKIRKMELRYKKEEINFLRAMVESVKASSNGINCLNEKLSGCNLLGEKKELKFVDVSKYEIINVLIKEYKEEYKKVKKDNKTLGLDGLFDNDLFCSIIKKRLNRFSICNKVTKDKYRHLCAFLNELLVEMENSKDPLKTLKQKIKIYERHKDIEIIKIKGKVISKATTIKNILDEYQKEKLEVRGCR